MTAADDIRLQQAHATPIAEVVDRLGLQGLNRTGGELVGPCPQCGGTDRFGVNLQRGVFQCRKDCGANCKGDQIALVQFVLGKSFPEALEWLVGPREELSSAERREIERKAEAHRRARAEAEAHMRRESIAAARDIWSRSTEAEGSLVRDYLAHRAITGQLLPAMPRCLRFMADCPYTVPDEDQRGRWRIVHRGPAMIAAVQGPQGDLTAVHRTWIDLGQPSGKAVITDPLGRRTDLPAKKVLGSKKGGAIRLSSPMNATTLVMGEGIETTLSGRISEHHRSVSAFWAGVDLGNMAGRRKLGEGLKYAGIPDLDDEEAFVPPAQITRLIFIQDGDSDPKLTRAKLEAGLRRAMVKRPGLQGAIVFPGEGLDLNDVLRGKA